MEKKAKKTTVANVELADNGFILRIFNPDMLMVYQTDDEETRGKMYNEILADIEDMWDAGETKLKVTVTVEAL